MLQTTVTDRTLTVVCRGELHQDEWMRELRRLNLLDRWFDYVDYTVDLDADGVEVHHWRMFFAPVDTTVQAS